MSGATGIGAAAAEIVADEVALLQSLVPVEGAHVLELGCGNGDFSRRLALTTPVGAITALEVDETQHWLNLQRETSPKITFGLGAAEAIPLDDARVDGIVMMKSWHHVPVERMDEALVQMRRVLKHDGWLYVSEPVYAGDLNRIIRLFHDEGVVRAAAYEALQRACRDGVFEMAAERAFAMRAHYASYDDFVARHVDTTHTKITLSDEVAAEVRRRFEPHMTPAGATFLRPMRVNVLRRG